MAATRPVHVIWARFNINAYLNTFSEGTLCIVGVNIILISLATAARDQNAPVLLDVNQVAHAQCVCRFLNALSLTRAAKWRACFPEQAWRGR